MSSKRRIVDCENNEDDEDDDSEEDIRSIIEKRIIVTVAVPSEPNCCDCCDCDSKMVDDPGIGFYASAQSIPPERRDKQTETVKAAKMIKDVIVVRSDENISPLMSDNEDLLSVTDTSGTKDVGTSTTKDAFEYLDHKGRGLKKNEPDVGILIEIDDDDILGAKYFPIPKGNKCKPPTAEKVRFQTEPVETRYYSQPADENPRRGQTVVQERSIRPPIAEEPKYRPVVEERAREPPNCKQRSTEPKPAKCDDKQFSEVAKSSKKSDRKEQMDDFSRLKCIPEIIIGEIDKEEATVLFEQVLNVGKSFLNWLNLSDSWSMPANSCAAPCSQPQTVSATDEQALAMQRKILSLEAEYLKLKREGHTTAAACGNKVTTKVDPGYSNLKETESCLTDEEITAEDVRPKMYSPSQRRNESEYNYNNRRNDDGRYERRYNDEYDRRRDDCYDRRRNEGEYDRRNNDGYSRRDDDGYSRRNSDGCGQRQQGTSSSKGRHTCNVFSANSENPVCSCNIEKRLEKLEKSLKNYDGDFTNVIAELRACLDYCNSPTQELGDDLTALIKTRIAKLKVIVDLHKKALEDWKKECSLPNKRK